jgi:hypothetical protein
MVRNANSFKLSGRNVTVTSVSFAVSAVYIYRNRHRKFGIRFSLLMNGTKCKFFQTVGYRGRFDFVKFANCALYVMLFLSLSNTLNHRQFPCSLSRKATSEIRLSHRHLQNLFASVFTMTLYFLLIVYFPQNLHFVPFIIRHRSCHI